MRNLSKEMSLIINKEALQKLENEREFLKNLKQEIYDSYPYAKYSDEKLKRLSRINKVEFAKAMQAFAIKPLLETMELLHKRSLDSLEVLRQKDLEIFRLLAEIKSLKLPSYN